MAYIYSKGIEHRDLKAENCLLFLQDGLYRVKLTDFGLSKSKSIVTTSTGRTSANGPAGTMTHMAPELLLKNEFTEKTDVYAFGITMWEVLTYDIAWKDCVHQAQINAQVGDGKRPSPIPEGIHRELVELMTDCWSGDPYVRPKFEDIVPQLRGLAPDVDGRFLRSYQRRLDMIN